MQGSVFPYAHSDDTPKEETLELGASGPSNESSLLRGEMSIQPPGTGSGLLWASVFTDALPPNPGAAL